MPDKRQLEEAFHLEPLPKRLACSSAVTGTVMSDERIFATLKHPRLENGGSSPFTTSPPFQQPAPICSFSFDEHRKQHQDDRSKRFYTRPPPYNNPHPHLTRAQPVFGADLNYGLERFTQRDDSLPEHLDALVAALQHRTENATGSEAEKDELDRERRRADVVTWRGIITKICSAYEQNAKAKFHDSIELNAMMLDNTLYLEEYTSAEAKAQKANKEANPKMKRMGYYGYCFESYCTVDTPAQVNQPFCAINPRTDSGTGLVRHPVGWSGDVNTNVQWCQVVKTKLGENRLVIGGEVDAVEYNPITGKQEMVELKTSMQMTRFQRGKFGKAMADQERFEKKLLKFFLQSYLLGVGKIVVGFRDDYGMLTTHQEFETLRLPRMVRAGEPIPGSRDEEGKAIIRRYSVWEPKDALGFGDQILTFIRQSISKHSSTTQMALREQQVQLNPTHLETKKKNNHPVYRITFQSPFTQVKIRQLTAQEIVQEVHDPNSLVERVGFLPTSFYDFVQSRMPPSRS